MSRIYRLNIRRRSPFTSHATQSFMSVYTGVFTLISSEDGLDPAHPSVRIACDLRTGAVFQNIHQLNVAATDGTRFEFELTEKDVATLEDVLRGNETLLAPAAW